MIITVKDSAPFQILTSAMVIGPSQTGYQLEVAADGRNFSPLFSVGPNVTRQATNLSSGAYYRLNGNVGDVVVNWRRSCVTEGGGSGSGTELTPVTSFPVGAEAGTVVALVSGDTVGVYQYDGSEWVSVASGEGGNSNILAAITSLTEYEAISGSVKTGDLIQVYGVDINDDEETETGLFQAEVLEGGELVWQRRDNENSLSWSFESFPWMTDNDVLPIEIGGNAFLVAAGSGEAYNGIGFDGDGKPVITNLVPEIDWETGEVTGMTRTDRDILGELDTMDEVVSAAIVDLKDTKVESQDVKYLVKLTQAEYDLISVKDPYTFYLIIDNN